MNTKHQNQRRTIRNIVIFIIVVLAIGWIARELDIAMGNPNIQIMPGTDWLISPMNELISIVILLMIGIGLRQSRRR